MIENAIWEQLSQVWSNDFVFVEAVLSEMATLLGMDENHITMDYEEFVRAEEDSPDIIMLYFKVAIFVKQRLKD